MSSTVKLTLRPPPNVDFVHGYPGIPPSAPDRPQAAVKGALEIRAGPQGVKAKWVRIELRKVETLPGGGPQNTFYDFVGPSPVNLWSSSNSEDYGVLRSHDFPFQIRIPESIPPTLALENRAGIRYELSASVCTKGKRGFLRKRKSNVVSTQSVVTVDKHELHSTWPIYCQPETRQISQDGVTLTVDRSQTCYGPGDRVSLMATLKSDSLHTIILRGFELTLKESTIFRAAPYNSGKKSVPQVRVVTISDNKFPVNATLYGGMMHKAELTCNISPNHTTTTLNSARHIDITYVLSVKALMGTGTHLTMDLPVILSNWQKTVSQEAVRRIGPAPSLTLAPGAGGSGSPGNAAMSVEPTPGGRLASTAQTYGGRSNAAGASRPPGAATYTPGGMGGASADEFGYNPGHRVTASRSSNDDYPYRGATGGTTTRRDDPNATQNTPNARTPGATFNATTRQWLTAEEEKERLYKEARDRAVATQGSVARGSSPPPTAKPAATPATPNPAPTPKPTTTPTSSPPSKKWLTAEEEKYNLAQSAVLRTQGIDPVPKSDSLSNRPSNGAGNASGSSSRVQSTIAPPVTSIPTPKAAMPFMSAEQEKAALRRYHEAKQAVERNAEYPLDQQPEVEALGGPVAYDALYPASQNAKPTVNGGDRPPPFQSPVKDAQTQLNEKARMKAAYEAQDAAAALAQKQQRLANNANGGAPPYEPPPFSQGAPTQPEISSAISEKEMLRRKFEAQDAAAARNQSPQTPARNASTLSSNGRPTPPPTAPTGARILSALEEKAMLRARYEAEDARSRPTPKQQPSTNGTPVRSNTSSPAPSVSTPPPLMPRPPAEYIQETREEDARVSRFALDGSISLDEDAKPVAPLNLSSKPGPPPPLPPKPADQ